jgi:hypothetical protein
MVQTPLDWVPLRPVNGLQPEKRVDYLEFHGLHDAHAIIIVRQYNKADVIMW